MVTAVLAIALLALAAGLLWAVGVQALQDERRPAGPPIPAPVPVRRPVRTDVPHALYYYLHATVPGRIYWGISNEPEARHGRHENDPRDQWWMRQSTGAMHLHRWYPNRETARAAERAAVRASAFAGEPIVNDHHNPLKVRRPRAVH